MHYITHSHCRFHILRIYHQFCCETWLVANFSCYSFFANIYPNSRSIYKILTQELGKFSQKTWFIFRMESLLSYFFIRKELKFAEIVPPDRRDNFCKYRATKKFYLFSYKKRTSPTIQSQIFNIWNTAQTQQKFYT